MPITDVQWILGHISLTTTQIYVDPTAEDVIEATLAHHTAANSKLAQADLTAARRAETVSLGIPAYRDVAAATLTAPADLHDH
jgi:hypothetical protein